MLRLVIADAVRVIAIGLAVGLALSTLLGRVLGTMLVGVPALDAMTFAVVPIVMAITAVGAMAGPAWRAARIDPAIALRVDH